jgi:hypothetical protein
MMRFALPGMLEVVDDAGARVTVAGKRAWVLLATARRGRLGCAARAAGGSIHGLASSGTVVSCF